MLEPWICLPLAADYWASTRDAYRPAFVARVEAAFADRSNGETFR